MKVACIGNMNNNFFNLVRYLRDNQINAELLLFNNEHSHFCPSADSYDKSYESFVKKLSWGNIKSYLFTSRKKIKNDLKEYDFFIVCGLAPAFLHKIDKSVDIFVPHGSDIYDSPFLLFRNLILFLKSIVISRAQKKGIQNSRFINMYKSNIEFEKTISSLHIKGKRLFSGVPMIYLPQYNSVDIQKNLEKSNFNNEFKDIRINNDVILFHHSRLIWKNPPDAWSYKGNEKIIKGFARFVKDNPNLRSVLVLFEYGVDINETKELIKDLDIEKFVQWFPKMNRKDIMTGIYYADICIGETGMSWLTYGVIYEALAMAKPFMGYREDSLYTDTYPELYPMINVFSEDQIAAAFANYVQNPFSYKNMGFEGYNWLKKYAIDIPLKEYLDILIKKNKTSNF